MAFAIRLTQSTRPRRDAREEKAEAFGHGEVREDGVAQLRKGKSRRYRGCTARGG
jgi:hypothetical protein